MRHLETGDFEELIGDPHRRREKWNRGEEKELGDVSKNGIPNSAAREMQSFSLFFLNDPHKI